MGRPKKHRKEGPLPPHLIEAFKDFRGVDDLPGVSLEPSDHIWTGEIGDLDIDSFFRDDRDPEGALDEILRAIIASNKSSELSQTSDERGEIAAHAILGRARKRGRPAEDDQPTIDLAVKLYFERSIDRRRGKQSWRMCIFDAYETLGFCLTEEPEQRDSLYERVYGKIAPQIDRLLVAHSAVGLPQWERRRKLISRILKDMRTLGIIALDDDH